MDRITAIKIKNNDGTYSDQIPISVYAENVAWDSTKTLVDYLNQFTPEAGLTTDNLVYQNTFTAIKLKKQDGTYSNEIPIGALAENITWDGSQSLVDYLSDLAENIGDGKYLSVENPTGTGSIAVGTTVSATGKDSQAFGQENTVSGKNSFAEGIQNTVSGNFSHAEGRENQITSYYSHAEGLGNLVKSDAQHVEGMYNIADENDDFIHIAGNGISDSERSNAYTLDVNGNAWFAGDVYVGSTSGKNKDGGSQKLITESSVQAIVKDISEALTAQVEQTSTGATITITDKNGTTTANIENGKNGQNGKDGAAGTNGKDGADGYSPTAAVSRTSTGAKITVTDKSGTTSVDIENGTATDEQVAAWLEAHPEATTTVEDGSISEAKLADDVKENLTNKVDINQGTENAGKVLVVGDDGKVVAGNAITVDQSLTISGAAADAKATGEEINNINERLDQYEDVFTGDVDESVKNWLDEHQEATTTVQDGSLTEAKFSDALKLKTIKDYSTPQMFGAVGDGVTDDSDAFIRAIASSHIVVIPAGSYKITKQIEITNTHRLLANGTVRIYTTVSGYAFWIHGNDGDDYESTNALYDNAKGVWFGGTNGGITLINNNGDNCILFGIETEYPSGQRGVNAAAQISNVGIIGYNIGIKITNRNNYLNAFCRVQFERCGTCVVFGDTETTKVNSGEMFKFIDCVFSTSNIGIKFESRGWECSFIGCSIDFCNIGFYDLNYIKVYFNNGHVEGVGKKSSDVTEYGIVFNQGDKSLYSFSNMTFDISIASKGTIMFRGGGPLVMSNCYVSTAIEKSIIEGEYFLSEHRVVLNGILFGQSDFRPFMSKENNLVPDAMLSNAVLGDTGTDITAGIKIGWKANCTSEVVNGSMFSGQKSIRFYGNGNASVNAIVIATIPVIANKEYNIGLAILKNHDKTIKRSVKVRFFSKDSVKIGESTDYIYTPAQAEKDVVYFPYSGKKVVALPGTEYMEILYSINTSSDVILESGEYVDIEYMYCEDW